MIKKEYLWRLECPCNFWSGNNAKEEKYYVDDGCKTEYDNNPDDIVGSFQSKSFLAGVRCCTISGSACVTPVDCTFQATTYDYAVSVCTQIGYRLCTKDELLSAVCCRTGGDCDNFPVWTSTSDKYRGD